MNRVNRREHAGIARMLATKMTTASFGFLGKAESNGGIPALEKEMNTEGEALVEALRVGVTFYAVQEFRVVPDLAGRRPQLTKEPVPGKKN